jgi:hypothetical protein
LLDGVSDYAKRDLPRLMPAQRSAVGELLQAILTHKRRIGDYFMHALREQVQAALAQQAPRDSSVGGSAAAPTKLKSLSLVDEQQVAADVELSNVIEAIDSIAEYELRELQTYVSALVGDMDVSADHNPFRPEIFAKALWAAAQALPMSRGHQVAFMRNASQPLAQVLRQSYAASSSRLEGMGIEPAAYRTLILPSGSRRGRRAGETSFTPDLQRIRESMPAPLDEPAHASLSYDGQNGKPRAGTATDSREQGRESWRDVARGTTNHVDRQSIELISRLFEAMFADTRVPPDVILVITRLHGPAMRLALRDPNLLDQDKHPLWRLINRLAFECEMAPDPADPDRQMLLKTALATVNQLASEPEQNSGLYRWALDQLESYLHKRLTRRLAGASTQIGALQKLEDRLCASQAMPSSLHGMLDTPQLDTVPAELMDDTPPPEAVPPETEAWLDTLRPGDWVRMFMQGRWVQARLLWPGERREVWLFGDGASDATWAVRRKALVMMHAGKLMKTLKQRSIVSSAAARVQEQIAATTGAAAA